MLPIVIAEMLPTCILVAYSVVLIVSIFKVERLPITVKLPWTIKLAPTHKLPPIPTPPETCSAPVVVERLGAELLMITLAELDT